MFLKLTLLLAAALILACSAQAPSSNATLPLIKTYLDSKDVLYVDEVFPAYFANKTLSVNPDLPDAFDLHDRDMILSNLPYNFTKTITFFGVLNPPREKYARILLYIQEESSHELLEFICSISLDDSAISNLNCDQPIIYPNLAGVTRILTQEQVISVVIERVDLEQNIQYLDVAVENMTNVTTGLANNISDPSRHCRDIGFLSFNQLFYCATSNGQSLLVYDIDPRTNLPVLKNNQSAVDHFFVDRIDAFLLNSAGEPVIKTGNQISIYQGTKQIIIADPFNNTNASDFIIRVLGDQELIIISPTAQAILQYNYGRQTPFLNSTYDLLNCTIRVQEQHFEVSDNLIFYALCEKPEGSFLLAYNPRSSYKGSAVDIRAGFSFGKLDDHSVFNYYTFPQFSEGQTSDLIFVVENNQLSVKRIHLRPFLKVNYDVLDFYSLTTSNMIDLGFDLTSQDVFEETPAETYIGEVQAFFTERPVKAMTSLEKSTDVKVSRDSASSAYTGEFSGFEHFQGTLIGVFPEGEYSERVQIRNTTEIIQAVALNLTAMEKLQVMNERIMTNGREGLLALLLQNDQGTATLLRVYSFLLDVSQEHEIISSLSLESNVTDLPDYCTDLYLSASNQSDILSSGVAIIVCSNRDDDVFELLTVNLTDGRIVWETKMSAELDLSPQLTAEINSETQSLIVFSSYLFGEKDPAISIYHFTEGSSTKPYIKVPFSAIKGEVHHSEILPGGWSHLLNHESQSFELMSVSMFDGLVYCTTSIKGNGSDAQCCSKNITDKVVQDFAFAYRPLWIGVKIDTSSVTGKFLTGGRFVISPSNGNSYMMEVSQNGSSAEEAASSFSFTIKSSFNGYNPLLKTSSIAYLDQDWLINNLLVVPGEGVLATFDASSTSNLNSFAPIGAHLSNYRVFDCLGLEIFVQINTKCTSKLEFIKTGKDEGLILLTNNDLKLAVYRISKRYKIVVDNEGPSNFQVDLTASNHYFTASSKINITLTNSTMSSIDNYIILKEEDFLNSVILE